jgi:outer membrane protein
VAKTRRSFFPYRRPKVSLTHRSSLIPFPKSSHLLFAGLALVLGMVGLRASETDAVQVLTLAEAREFALANHPRVAAARHEAGAADEAVKEVRSAEFPTVNLYGTAAGANSANDRIMAGALNNPSIYDRVAGGVSVSQLITDFGHTANLRAGSQCEARAESEKAADVREQVWLKASTSYYSALEAQAVLQVAHETVQSRTLLLEQVQALATNQLKSELDVSFARVALEEGRLLEERAQNGVDAAMATLTSALGLRDTRPFQLVEPPTPLLATNAVEALIQTALGQRPELLSRRARRDAAQRFARSEKDARRPTISAEGVMGNSPNHDDRLANNYAAADLNVSLPVFSGGRNCWRRRRLKPCAMPRKT